VYELRAGIDLTFCVFPKSPGLFEPGKGTFDDPALRQDSEGMKLIAFCHLHGSTKPLLNGVGKGLSAVAAIHEQATNLVKAGRASLNGL